MTALLAVINLVPRVRDALSSRTGNGDLWDNPFQPEFSLVDHLSMSSRTRSQKVNKNGGKESAERLFQVVIKRGKSNILLLNANLRSSKALKGRGVCLFCLNANDIGFNNKVHKITLKLNQPVCGNKHLHAKEFSIKAVRSV